MEQLVYDLGKDVAVMVETQRAFQLHQTRTTENVDKLAGTVQVLLKETTKLETIFNNLTTINTKIDRVEKTFDRRMGKVETAYANWAKAVGVALLVGAIGAIFKFVIGA